MLVITNLKTMKEKIKITVQTKQKQLKKTCSIPILFTVITTDNSLEYIGVYHFKQPSLSLSLYVGACVYTHKHTHILYVKCIHIIF